MIPDWKIIKSDIIDPMVEEQDSSMGPSFGPSPYGYDLRLGENYIIKVGELLQSNCIAEDGIIITMEPGEFILAETMEIFDMPNDTVGMVFDKSTYARKGITTFNTIIEPGWKGKLTLEIVNHSSGYQELIVGAGIVQVIFFKNPISCAKPYNGKYQDDKGVQVAKL